MERGLVLQVSPSLVGGFGWLYHDVPNPVLSKVYIVEAQRRDTGIHRGVCIGVGVMAADLPSILPVFPTGVRTHTERCTLFRWPASLSSGRFGPLPQRRQHGTGWGRVEC